MSQIDKDLYFLRIAKEASTNCKCLSRKIGTVLVKNGCVVSTGYNGPAKGVKHCNERPCDFYLQLEQPEVTIAIKTKDYPSNCPRKDLGYKSGQGLHLCQAVHAERNAILQAGMNGIATKGATLYCYCGRPCKDCMIEIVNSGISELVFLEKDNPKTQVANNSGSYDEYSGVILEESGIKYRTIKESLI
jgi:dCMP deaminase